MFQLEGKIAIQFKVCESGINLRWVLTVPWMLDAYMGAYNLSPIQTPAVTCRWTHHDYCND